MSPTKVKFCGCTSVLDAELAVSCGAWAVGVILWPGSPRLCDPATAAEIGTALKRRAEVVGVFVDERLDQVAAIADAAQLTMLQFHGDEGPSFCAEAARRTGCRVIKAARVRSGADIQAVSAFHTDFHLLDGYVSGRPGGTGATFSWELVREHRGSAPVILSGGLTPENVGEAIAATSPFAVDVASGVERSPGVKDPDKLRAFAASVLEAGPHAARPGLAHAPGRRSAHAPTGTSSG